MKPHENSRNCINLWDSEFRKFHEVAKEMSSTMAPKLPKSFHNFLGDPSTVKFLKSGFYHPANPIVFQTSRQHLPRFRGAIKGKHWESLVNKLEEQQADSLLDYLVPGEGSGVQTW